MKTKKSFLLGISVYAIVAMFSALASAQSFPSKPIKIIVSYPAGGSTDGTARQLAIAVSEKTGQPVVVENRPGGATVIAAQALVSAPPDGYTLALFDASPVSMNQHLFKKLSYDPGAITPITTIVKLQLVLVTSNASPVKSLKDYVDMAKAKPNGVSFGSTGAGNLVHLSMERFNSLAGVEATHVPYKGAAPALQDLIGGQYSVLMVDLPSALPFIKAGQLRALAIPSPTRAAILPDVPTFAEAGYPNFSAGAWTGIFAPPGTPAPVLAQLNTLFREAASSPKVTTWIRSVSLEPATSTQRDFANLVKSDSDSYGATIRRLGISLD